jgi:hypothetical protein
MAVDTSTVGSHTLRVTATSNDGPAGTASVTYVVAAPPSARISSPAGVARYVKGQVVDASYGRVEGAGGPGISSCTGTVAAGDPIDTSSVGQHAFTVTARSKDGQSATSTVSYTVLLPDNRFTVPQVKTCREGTVSLAVKVPGRGTIDVLETAWNDNMARVAVLLQPASSSTRASTPTRPEPGRCGCGSYPPRVAAGVHDQSYCVTLRLCVSYTPRGGVYRSVGSTA